MAEIVAIEYFDEAQRWADGERLAIHSKYFNDVVFNTSIAIVFITQWNYSQFWTVSLTVLV